MYIKSNIYPKITPIINNNSILFQATNRVIFLMINKSVKIGKKIYFFCFIIKGRAENYLMSNI